MKAKSELKAALEALQVRKPLRLPSSAPTFAPPPPQVASQAMVVAQTQVREDTPIAVETLVSPEALVDVSTSVPMQTQVESVSIENQKEQATLVAGDTQVAQKASVAVGTLVDIEAKVSNATPVSELITVSGGTKARPEREVHHAPEQDSAVVLEAQANPKLQHGYTRIPNVLLMQMVSGGLLRSEMQVALLIARLTISYQRRFSPISKAVIERQTGLRGPAVLHALSELVAKGVIEKIPGDQNRPNQFGLASAQEVLSQVSTATRVPVQTGVAAVASAPVSTANSPLVSGGTHFKYSETNKNNNSLSSLPPVLRDYFSELKPERKRESEWKAFQELNAEYSADDIADCFAIVESRGISVNRDGIESTVRCHSPMAFLSKAIGGVLEEVQAKRSKARERAEREQREAQEKRLRMEKEAREAAEWAEKERAFRRAFPGDDRQHEVIAEFCRDLPFRPHSEAGRTLAITTWWDGLTKYEQAESIE